ncbi:MAG: DUF4377 domain-containing protein [Deltaproteobacteria bacterium]|nr:DUF4377 domain-containing protein [Deltaproteobacteria bacterium]
MFPLFVALLAACATGPQLSTLIVGPDRVACVGMGPMECLETETPTGERSLAYDPIVGFEHQLGQRATLEVKITEVPDPPADGSSRRTELVRVVATERAYADGPCAGAPVTAEPNRSSDGAVRTLGLRLTFCDGTARDLVISEGPEAWVIPSDPLRAPLDPEGAAAGAVLSMRSRLGGQERMVRVLPVPEGLSVVQGVRPLTTAEDGPVPVGALETAEVMAIALPPGATLVRVEPPAVE